MLMSLRTVWSSFALTRCALFAIAVFAVWRLPINAVEAQGFHLAPQPHTFLEAWARYDACWYASIAEHGYRAPIGPYGDMRPAFFPLFPALTAVITPLARTPMLAGLLVSNACYLTFVVLLWALVRLDWGAAVAGRTIWIYLLFPSAFFLSGAYSESLLLVTAAGALLAARRQRWIVAGVLAGCATVTRPIGFVAIVPCLLEYVTIVRANLAGGTRAPLTPLAALVGAPLVAVGGYLWFAAATFGDLWAPLIGQVAIRGPMAAPWQPFVAMWQAGPRLHAFDNSLLDAALALIAVAALPAIYRRVRPSYAVYAGLVVLIPLSGSLISFNRLLLASFPHAILLAQYLKRPWQLAAVLVPFAVLEIIMMTAFATWNWVA